MVNRVVVFLLISIYFSYGATLDDKIKSFVSKYNYTNKKMLIDKTFANKQEFYFHGNIDTIKILTKLKNNGLLNFIFEYPKKQSIEFRTSEPSLLFLKNITTSINELGYSFFVTSHVKINSNGFLWKIEYESRNAIDPILLTKELSNRGCEVIDISRTDDGNWIYDINTKSIFLDRAIVMGTNTYKKIDKQIDEYYLKLNNNSKSIVIQSSPYNSWFPYIVFLDREMNVLKIFKQNSTTTNLTVDVPKLTKYVKVSDLYMLNNIKRGLNILIKD